MAIALPLIDNIMDIGGKVIDRVWPDPESAHKAKMEMARLAQDGEFRALETRMSAIIAEANSSDPWTSRARPSFMYVIYIMILASIPYGVLFAFHPETAAGVSQGVQAWLGAIPEELWYTFGAGYLGYSHFRTREKVSGVTK